jgi:hypothetical protein
VEIGKLMSARIAFLSSLDRVGSLYTLTIKGIDITTGRIIDQVSEECRRCGLDQIQTVVIPAVVRKLGILAKTAKAKLGIADSCLHVIQKAAVVSSEFTQARAHYQEARRLAEEKHYAEFNESIERCFKLLEHILNSADLSQNAAQSRYEVALRTIRQQANDFELRMRNVINKYRIPGARILAIQDTLTAIKATLRTAKKHPVAPNDMGFWVHVQLNRLDAAKKRFWEVAHAHGAKND